MKENSDGVHCLKCHEEFDSNADVMSIINTGVCITCKEIAKP